ncbi:MAG TPA: tetratricopeptide repeat protein [Pyrinomonadaceae bacterium]|nr:tetratricopeptide repeat protein [Pyrinomonadaceae bacterium]
MPHPDELFNTAQHWLRVGRFDQAFFFYRAALAKYQAMKQTSEVLDQSCRCCYLAAKASRFLGNEAEAEDLLMAAVRLAPSVPNALTRAGAFFTYGEFLVEHGRNNEAILHLQAALSLNDYPANGWRLLGVALDECGKHTEAHSAFERALQNDPFNPQVLYNLAVCLGYLNRVDDSREAFDQAIELSPAEDHVFRAQAYNARGGMLLAAGQFEEAENSFLSAIQHDPKHDGAAFNLAHLLEKQGRDEEALHYWKKAVEFDPSDTTAAMRLKRLQSKLGVNR